MADGPRELFTVGHSNHDSAKFVELLSAHGIAAVADVRSQPYSQYTPQFNRETLENVLRRHRIGYIFMGRELGARREERECYVAGKARYDLIRRLPPFAAGLERMRHEARTQRIALMCSEKDPLTCHRTILVCRALRASKLRIEHILEDGTLESQDAAEGRLLKLAGLPEADLFHDRGTLVEQAYDMQAEAIAYVEPAGQAAETARAAT